MADGKLDAETLKEWAGSLAACTNGKASELQRLARALLAANEESERIKDRDQGFVDDVCHYRNLAIALGAKPEQMRNRYDRGLCEKKLVDSVEAGNACEVWEIEERAESAESSLKLANERAERLAVWRDEALALARQVRDHLQANGAMLKPYPMDCYSCGEAVKRIFALDADDAAIAGLPVDQKVEAT